MEQSTRFVDEYPLAYSPFSHGRGCTRARNGQPLPRGYRLTLIKAQRLQREDEEVCGKGSAERVDGLAEALNALNRAGLADAYKQMYNDYRDTGLFKRETLKRVGEVTGSRYIAQIKLQGFGQGAKERFGALGFRIVETRYASVRIFFQIWDSSDGTIAWEGMQEMLYARDRITEEPAMLNMVVERTARDLIARLP